MTDAVIYTRVSKLARSISVADQLHECRERCAESDWHIRAEFCDDGISASRYGRHRPQWEAAKAALRPGDVLVVWEASRATRDLEEYVSLRSLCTSTGVLLAYGDDTLLDMRKGSDRRNSAQAIVDAEYESEKLKERAQRGKRSAARKGEPSGRPPWGYRQVSVNGVPVPKTWEPDPVEAPRIREAVEGLLSGATWYSVLAHLRATDGYTPKSQTMMKRALLNPALAGLRVHLGEVVRKATWEPIITPDQHHHLVAHSKALSATYSRERHGTKYLLTGIATCGVCDDGLRYHLKRGRVTPVYRCHRGHVSIPVPVADEAVRRKVIERLSEVNPSDYESADVDDAAILAEIDGLERELDEAQAGLPVPLTGRSLQMFAQFEQQQEDRIEALRAKLVAPPQLELDPDEWPSLAVDERRRIVRALFTVKLPKRESYARATVDDLLVERR